MSQDEGAGPAALSAEEVDHREFLIWMLSGIQRGWVSAPCCAVHDGIPGTPEEDALDEDGYDPCAQILRVWV